MATFPEKANVVIIGLGGIVGSSVAHHLIAKGWKDIVGIFQTGGLELDQVNFQISCVRENTEVINRSDNWLKLSFLESLAIKEWKPELNRGLKSCKDLSLF